VGLIPDENITWIQTNDTAALAAGIIDIVNSYQYREESFIGVRAAVIRGFSDLHHEEQLRTIYRRVGAFKE
jgi:hypothetical protein